jgi:diacylglycerol kinase (ATP)
LNSQIQYIALLVNSRSGKKKAFSIAKIVADHLQQLQIATAIYTDTWPLKLEEFSDIWIFGGDGTLNYFVNKYPDCQKPISIFSAGTGNDFAFILYGTMDPVQQAMYVLNAPVRKVDAGSCNSLLFMNGVGLGFDGEVLKSMKQIRKIGGGVGYLMAVIRQIFFFKETSFIIDDGASKDKKNLLLFMVNNSSRTGGGFYVSPKSTVNDGLLDLVTCKPLSVIQRLLHLPKIKKGNHLHLPFVNHQTLENITVTSSRKIYGQLDGELISGEKFEFSVLKDHFLFRY